VRNQLKSAALNLATPSDDCSGPHLLTYPPRQQTKSSRTADDTPDHTTH